MSPLQQRSLALAVVFLFSACGLITMGRGAATPGSQAPVTTRESTTPPGSPESTERQKPSVASQDAEVSCSDQPQVATPAPWLHPTKSKAVVALGTAHPRGIDLIASLTSEQVIRGEIHYGSLAVDKALEGEAIDLFACRAGVWKPLRQVITNGEGEFELLLKGDERLPVGMSRLYLSVVGDRRTGSEFLALIVSEGSTLAVSDVDGTLTSSEKAFPDSLSKVTGDPRFPVAAHDGSSAALLALRQHGYCPVYVTSRGRFFTGATRTWLRDNGFPAGPLRLAPSRLTLPGRSTVKYKADAMRAITANGLVVSIGIGNRATDAQAYQQVNVASSRTFLKLPEFAKEVDPVINAKKAVGFDSYRSLPLLPEFQALPAGNCP